MIPPRWLIRIGWAVHKGIGRLTRGRVGTTRSRPGRLGTLFIITTGRTTGRRRRNGVFFLDHEDGVAVVASNAGADADPAWWRNLQARPDAVVELRGRRYAVRARALQGAERERVYRLFEEASRQFTVYRESTARTIPVVVLERVSE